MAGKTGTQTAETITAWPLEPWAPDGYQRNLYVNANQPASSRNLGGGVMTGVKETRTGNVPYNVLLVGERDTCAAPLMRELANRFADAAVAVARAVRAADNEGSPADLAEDIHRGMVVRYPDIETERRGYAGIAVGVLYLDTVEARALAAWLTVPEAAARRGVSPKTVRDYIARGLLTATKRGRDNYLRLADVDGLDAVLQERGRPRTTGTA